MRAARGAAGAARRAARRKDRPEASALFYAAAMRHRRLAFPIAVLALAAGAAPAGAAVAVTFADGTVTVAGDEQPNVILVRLGADPARLVVDAGGDGVFELDVARAAVARIAVSGGAGDDAIDVNPGAALAEPAAIDGGDGSDAIAAAAGVDAISGGAGDDQIDPGQSDDRVDGGAGSDRVVWAPGDGSDAIEGGTGPDTLLFESSNASEAFTLAPAGDRVRLTRNVGNIVLESHRVERFELRALGGADTLTAAAGLAGLVALDADLGAGVDFATGGDGDDRIAGGDDGDTLVGGDGDDLLLGGDGDDALGGGDGDDVVDGGAGANALDGATGFDSCIGPGTQLDCETTLLRLPPARFAPFEPDPGPPPAPPETVTVTQTVTVPGPIVTVPDPVREIAPAPLRIGRVQATAAGLTIVVRNPASVAQTAELGARERIGKRNHRYATATRTIPAGGTKTIKLRAPAALRRALAAARRSRRRLTRRPTVTLRGVGRATTARPTLR
jgi:hypothetical protein